MCRVGHHVQSNVHWGPKPRDTRGATPTATTRTEHNSVTLPQIQAKGVRSQAGIPKRSLALPGADARD